MTYQGYGYGVRRVGGRLQLADRSAVVQAGTTPATPGNQVFGRPDLMKARRPASHVPGHFEETAGALPPNQGVLASGGIVGRGAAGLMDGYIPHDPQIMRYIVRDMYLYDPVTGCYVDQVSNMVYSDFTLSCHDGKNVTKYSEVMEAMRIKTVAPATIRDFLVNGVILGLVQTKDNHYLPLRTFSTDDVTLRPNIMFGNSPEVRLNYASAEAIGGFGAFGGMSSNVMPAPRISDMKELDERTRKMLTGSTPLPDDRCIYVPRMMFSYDWQGFPFFTRLIPLWQFEKSMLRGTMAAAERRQGGIIHASMGSDEYPVTIEQLQAMATAIYETDLDPVTAILTTRHDVQIQEVAGSSDLWKWNDIADSITAHKLKGIGATESMLSGEMSWSSIDATMTVFIQNIRILRDYQTRCMMYEKVFPFIATREDLRKSTVGRENAAPEEYTSRQQPLLRGPYDPLAGNFHWPESGNVRTIDGRSVDIRELDLPVMHYINNFRPEGDQNFLSMLQTLVETFHLPVPLRMIYAAGGLNLDDMLRHFSEEAKTRDELEKYQHIMGLDQPTTQEQGSAIGRMIAQMKGTDKSVSRMDDESTLFVKRSDMMYSPINSPRERKRINEAANREIAVALDVFSRRFNYIERRKREMLHDKNGRPTTFNYTEVPLDLATLDDVAGLQA